MLQYYGQLMSPLQIGVSGLFSPQVRDRPPQSRLCRGRTIVAQRTIASRAVESSTSDRSIEGERNPGRKIYTMRRLVAISFFLAATASTSIASTLSDAAAQLQPGNWVRLSAATSQQTAMQQSGAWLTSQSNDVGYDPSRRIAHYVGKRQNSFSHRHIYYREATHDWVVGTTVSGVTSGHGYDHQAVDPVTGYVYFRPYGANPSRAIYRASPSNLSSWSRIPDWPLDGYVQVALAMTWWSGSFSGVTQGALVVYNSGASGGEILIYDPASNGWETSISGFGGSSTYHSVMVYSPIHNVAVLGGGNGNSRQVWRLNPDRSVTQLKNAPRGYGVEVSGGGAGYIVNDPVTGNFLLVSKDGTMWELDPTGSGTWTQLAGNAAPPSEVYSAGRGNITWAVPTLGVVVFAGVGTSGTNPQMWLYKHAPSEPIVKPREPTDLDGN